METYESLAEFIYWIHWSFIILITLGPILHLYSKVTRYLFWILFAAGVFGNLWFQSCPLTMLETALRESGQYILYSSGSFICNHFKDWFNVDILPKTVDSAYCAMGFITALTPQFPRLLKVKWSKLLHETRKKMGMFPK